MGIVLEGSACLSGSFESGGSVIIRSRLSKIEMKLPPNLLRRSVSKKPGWEREKFSILGVKVLVSIYLVRVSSKPSMPVSSKPSYSPVGGVALPVAIKWKQRS
jgi:hypothetical protein